MSDNKTDHETNPSGNVVEAKSKRFAFVKWILLVLLPLLTIGIGYAIYVYASSPSVIRKPSFEHYHFRMQVVVDGKAENFASDAYQIDYDKGQCNANLAEQPIHFHDKKDQFTHIHWSGMTGGMVLKYYGWNFIGGMDSALGYKLDKLSNPQKVNIHGNLLPKISTGSQYYIYTGNETSYKERNFEDFKNQDLELFFGKASNVTKTTTQTNLLDRFFAKASAHGTANDADGDDGATATTVQETEDEKLTRINNLIGNVVIFAQNGKPTDQEVKDRFSKLEPLSTSTCGG